MFDRFQTELAVQPCAPPARGIRVRSSGGELAHRYRAAKSRKFPLEIGGDRGRVEAMAVENLRRARKCGHFRQ
jgi:hypothetical protein